MIEQFGYRQELQRSLSLFDLVVYGLLVIVTTSPMTTFGIVYNASHGMVPLVYAVGLVAMIFTALSYVMMSRAFPVAGSVYTYAGRSIGETAGFLAGWVMHSIIYLDRCSFMWRSPSRSRRSDPKCQEEVALRFPSPLARS